MTEIGRIVEGLAARHAVAAAHVHAVVDVESGGAAFTTVRDRFGSDARFPLCRFEGHLFHRLLSGAKRDAAVAAGLAHPKAGKVKNPATQQGRYDLWRRACEIDEDAATAACSWGVGQVLASHWRKFGLASPRAIYDLAAASLEGPTDLAAKAAGVPNVAHVIEAAASGLLVVAGVVGVAAAGYAVWQWVRSRRTYEGVSA